MVFKKNGKKGQAAIEFLMTYGWMLLVVLIVGALIFSFVDFSSLMPNKVDLSGNIKGDAAESFASANTAATGDGNSYVVVTFQYNGAKQAKITSTDGTIKSDIDGLSCNMQWVKNVDTDTDSLGGASQSGVIVAGANNVDPVVFLNGQTGIAEFECSALNGGSGLIEKDSLEGTITIQSENAKTGIKTPTTGVIRLTINS